jgi:4-amino-4-deoxy-L-arabinose transferase-like glycosyltransferase
MARKSSRFLDFKADFHTTRRTSVLVSLSLYALFSLLAIRSVDATQDWDAWSDDFALYLRHARNLAQGLGYTDTKFVFNPVNYIYSPHSYPPGFPALLAPVYAARGLDLYAVKLFITLCLLLSIPLCVVVLARQFGKNTAYGATALFALSPILWDFHKYILPDIPFLLLSLLALLVLQRREGASGSKEIALSLLAGTLIYASYATRILGITLLIAVVCRDFVQRPRGLRRTLVLLAAFSLGLGLQRWILGNLDLYETGTRSGLPSVRLSSGPKSVFGLCFQCVPSNIRKYWADLGQLAPLPYPGTIVLASVVSLAILAGIVFLHFRHPRGLHVWLQDLSVSDFYVAGYLGVLLLMQFSEYRYLIPVLPFLLAYGLYGAGVRWQKGTLLLMLALFVAYAVSYRTLARQEPDGRIDTNGPEARNLYSFIRTNTPENSLIAFTKPRALALFTDRRSTLRSGSSLDADLADYLLRHVDYVLVVVGQPPPLFRPPDPRWFFDPRWRNAFSVEYDSPHFQLLRLIPDKARVSLRPEPNVNGGR